MYVFKRESLHIWVYILSKVTCLFIVYVKRLWKYTTYVQNLWEISILGEIVDKYMLTYDLILECL